MLGDFFATPATRAVDDQARFERAERERAEREARERRERVTGARTDRPQKEVAGWQTAERIREYVARLQIPLQRVEPLDRDRLAAWRVGAGPGRRAGSDRKHLAGGRLRRRPRSVLVTSTVAVLTGIVA